jgi:hypothetical protein
MAEKNATKVCRDRQENNAVMCRQKQVSSSTGDSTEVVARGNIHIQEREVMIISCVNVVFVIVPSI